MEKLGFVNQGHGSIESKFGIQQQQQGVLPANIVILRATNRDFGQRYAGLNDEQCGFNYPLVICYIAIWKMAINSGFSH